jgi:hypothetical protein
MWLYSLLYALVCRGLSFIVGHMWTICYYLYKVDPHLSLLCITQTAQVDCLVYRTLVARRQGTLLELQ